MTEPRAYTVVVGVGSIRSAEPALRWAVAEARDHDGRVLAVRAWRPTPPTATGTRPPLQTYDAAAGQAQAQARFEEEVAAVVGGDVACRVVAGGRRQALLGASRQADLLVLGAPRRLRPGGLGFAHRLLCAASCPIVVMPARHDMER